MAPRHPARVTAIPIGPSATEMAVAPSGRTAYFIDNGGSPLLTVVNLVTRKRRSVALGADLTDLAVSPGGKQVYVTSSGDGVPGSPSVYVVDAATDRVVHKIDVGGSAGAVAFSPRGGTAYVVQGSQLVLIDVLTSQVQSSIETG